MSDRFQLCGQTASTLYEGATSALGLRVRPPADAERGSVSVHVTRQSDGKEAVVEFSLDSRAAGAGCYTV